MVGSFLAVSGLEVLVGIDVKEIVCNFVHSRSSRIGQERAEAKVDPDFPAVCYGPQTLLHMVLDPSR